MSARAFWWTAPGQGAIREETLPPARPGEVLVETLASGVSRGTESLVAAGRVPESQHAAMRAPLMGGDFPFPVKYGYAAVGRTPDGRRVFVLHPHQDRFLAPEAMCVPVPDALPTARAVLGANMETALNIGWDAGCLPGERVLIVGAGVVGLLAAALLARIPGTEVAVADVNAARAPLAAALGCSFTAPAEAPGGRDLVVHASGTEAGLRLALDRAGFEGRIIEASWFGNRLPALPLGEAFHARRLQLVSSQVGAVARPMRGRRSHAERLALALRLLTDPVFDRFLEAPTRFEALPAAMPEILAGDGLCHVITYGSE